MAYDNSNSKTVQITCAECGKEEEKPEALAKWMEKNLGKVVCSDCYREKYAKKRTVATSNTTAPVSKAGDIKKDTQARTFQKVEFKPEHFLKVMDEFRAVFGDDFKVAVDAGAIGGWVTTVLLSRRDTGKLK